MNTKSTFLGFALLVGLLLVLAGLSATPRTVRASSVGTIRVSVASDGTQGNGGSQGVAVSADGRYVTFLSYANNLVPDDTNGKQDVFVHDRVTGRTERVSVASNGIEANGHSWMPAISDDGRYVVFQSDATNLVADDTNGKSDIFVHDRLTGRTERVSVASDGTQVNDTSWNPAISADGRYVAFASTATNLVSGDTNGKQDVFVHDRQTGQTVRVSVASDGTQANDESGDPALSGDGRYVAFVSPASNLVAGDTNNQHDVFVHNLETGQTERVSVATGGTQGNGASGSPALSADGRYVAFASIATNLVSGDTNGKQDVFVHDCQAGQTERVSVASGGTQSNGGSSYPTISADGRYVAFLSFATNLVPGDTNGKIDIFVYDRQTGQTARVSVANNDAQANDNAGASAISADGFYVAFGSDASNLVSGDTNGQRDIFLRVWHAPSVSHTLSGRVYAGPTGLEPPQSSPLSEVTVSLYCAATNGEVGTFLRSTATDANGWYGLPIYASDSCAYFNIVETDPPGYASDGATTVDGNVVTTNWIQYASPVTQDEMGNKFWDVVPNVFEDVPDDHWAIAYINRLYNAGITTGCSASPLNYCPDDPVTRAQMAVFLMKSLHYPNPYTPPDVPPTFSDTAGHWAEDWIEALKAAGITSGYPDGTYRPDNGVTRAEMAAFLLRAKHGASYTPPAVVHSHFNDVSDSHWAKDWIEQLAVEGITSGYPDGSYHPDQIVTRAEMSVFLVRAFKLP